MGTGLVDCAPLESGLASLLTCTTSLIIGPTRPRGGMIHNALPIKYTCHAEHSCLSIRRAEARRVAAPTGPDCQQIIIINSFAPSGARAGRV